MRLRLWAAAVLAALAATAVLTTAGRPGAHANAGAEAECEGDACQQVSVTFDESKQQYRAVNNSSSRWVSVTASNVAASAGVCLGPGKEAYMPLKSIEGAYRAAYAEPRCGESPAAGPPGE